jgi:MYXO-CTERM domain-containing protein
MALLVMAVLCVAGPALALKQPNNTIIPVGPSIQNILNGRGEMVNALADAADTPETFTPTCKLEFEVIARLAGYKNSFGWYNVTGQKPAPADLHEFISCNDGVGTKKPLNILNDPNYKGGDIGFYQATGGCATVQNNSGIMYSEKKYNPDNNQANPFIHLIIYNSTVTPKAFYFCWEDLFSGGDNDFDDLLMFVTGIGCTGSGAKCATGKPGVCGDGVLQCQSGQLKCLQLTQPSQEKCDGLDNDCSGTYDEGDICPSGQVCDKGSCVPKCDAGEFKCPQPLVCSAKGLCVEEACKDIDCPENTKCTGGMCVGPCDGVVCPYGQSCLAGACADPCTKFTCDADQVCSLGACVEKCQCAGCKMGDVCQPSGLCVPSACNNVNCGMGTHCDANGMCVDDCLGAKCPSGQECKMGQCVPKPNASGAGGAGGSTSGTDSTGAFMDSAPATSGSGGKPGTGGAGNTTLESNQTGGCGCIVGEGPDARAWAAAALALAIAARRRRWRS